MCELCIPIEKEIHKLGLDCLICIALDSNEIRWRADGNFFFSPLLYNKCPDMISDFGMDKYEHVKNFHISDKNS